MTAGYLLDVLLPSCATIPPALSLVSLLGRSQSRRWCRRVYKFLGVTGGNRELDSCRFSGKGWSCRYAARNSRELLQEDKEQKLRLLLNELIYNNNNNNNNNKYNI